MGHQKESLEKRKREVEEAFERLVGRRSTDEGLLEALRQAQTIHLISTPYGGGASPAKENVAGAEKAVETKRKLHKPPHAICVEPNTDLEVIARKYGMSAEEQGKFWLDLWGKVLRVAQETRHNGSTVQVMCHEK